VYIPCTEYYRIVEHSEESRYKDIAHNTILYYSIV
jgi:hypothetical protein